MEASDDIICGVSSSFFLELCDDFFKTSDVPVELFLHAAEKVVAFAACNDGFGSLIPLMGMDFISGADLSHNTVVDNLDVDDSFSVGQGGGTEFHFY